MAKRDTRRLRPGHWLARNGLWLTAAVAFVIGVWGNLRAGASCGTADFAGFLDAIYRTLQSFGLNFDLPTCPAAATTKPGMNWQLELSRFLAFGAAFYAVLSVFFAETLSRVKMAFQVRFRGGDRHLLLGFGAVNRAAAAALRAQTPPVPVTAVDRDFDAVDRRLARDLGILLLTGELSDQHTLRRARPDRAHRVTIAVGDDIRAIEVAEAVAPLVEAGLVDREIRWSGRLARRLRSLSGRCVALRTNKLIWLGRLAAQAADRLEKGLPIPKQRPAGQDTEGDWVLRAHISDPMLLSNLTDARDLADARSASFQPFNLKVETAASFVYLADLVRRARDHRQERVHLIIVGLGHQGESILLETLMTSYATGLKPPKITVLDRCAADAKARLHARYPRLMENRLASLHGPQSPISEGWEPIAFHEIDIEKVDFTSDTALDDLDNAPGLDTPTAWVFCCGKDALNEAAAYRLEVAMQQQARRAVPIFARLWGSGLHPPPARPRNIFGLTQSFGDSFEVAQSSRHFDSKGDRLARKVHLAYLNLGKLFYPAEPADSEQYRYAWADLPESVRESNRRPARHLAFKLRELGIDWPEFRAGALPSLTAADSDIFRGRIRAEWNAAKDAMKTSAENPEKPRSFTIVFPELLSASHLEHSAWAIERSAKGWSHSPTRNNLRRVHNFLVPFAELSPDAKAYDLVALYVALDKASTDSPQSARRWKRIVRDICDPVPDSISGCTEIVLSIRLGSLTGEEIRSHEEAVQAWGRALHVWATDPCASRLQLVLHAPVALPPERDRTSGDAKAIDTLTKELAGIPARVNIDVTRLYEPQPVPQHSAVPQTRAAPRDDSA